jgi:hypothetical protein
MVLAPGKDIEEEEEARILISTWLTPFFTCSASTKSLKEPLTV